MIGHVGDSPGLLRKMATALEIAIAEVDERMQDLSSLAHDGPWVSSMAGGNMTSSNELAMTGKGTEPVDPLPDRESQGDPKVGVTDTLNVNFPPGRIKGSTYAPSSVAWKTTEA